MQQCHVSAPLAVKLPSLVKATCAVCVGVYWLHSMDEALTRIFGFGGTPVWVSGAVGRELHD